MKTKLTLRMEDDLIERAKQWARCRGVSLSHVVASVFEQLPSRRGPSGLSPWTKRLVGVSRPRKGRPPTDAVIREAHLDHLAKRHR